MTEAILLRQCGDVAEVILNRPTRRNALSGEAIGELADAFRRLGDADLGAIVLRGERDFFCAGLDLDEFTTQTPPLEAWIAVHRAIADLETPVVACLLGGAINAGAALVLAADLVVAGETAYLQVMEAAIGMVPTVNAAWLAVRHPASVSMQLALPGRRFSAPDLHRLAVATEVVPDDQALDRARELAAQLAAFPAHAAARTKRVLRAARENDMDFASAAAAALAAGNSL